MIFVSLTRAELQRLLDGNDVYANQGGIDRSGLRTQTVHISPPPALVEYEAPIVCALCMATSRESNEAGCCSVLGAANVPMVAVA